MSQAAADAFMGIFGFKRVVGEEGVEDRPMIKIKTKRVGSKLTPRICKCCGKGYTPARPMQKACSLACALELGKGKTAEDKAKADRKALREGREKQKTRTDWANEAQTAFNAWKRYVDLAAGHGCISCGTKTAKQWHAGHYRNVKTNKKLRYHPDNVWLQCSQCNDWEGGNKIEYRINLVKRIGTEKVEWLESSHEPKTWSIEELKAIRDEYRQKLKELKSNQGDHP